MVSMMGMFVGYCIYIMCIYIICIYIYDYHGDMYVYQRLIHYTRGDITGDHFYLRNQKKTGNVTAFQWGVRDDWWRNAPWIYPAW